MDTTGSWKLTFIICYAEFLLQKSMAFKQNLKKNFDRFFAVFSLQNYRANSQANCLIQKHDFGNRLYFTDHSLFFSRKKIRFPERHVFEL